eukprot:6208001-Pyramimonas_sp.AAC.1
MDRVGKSGHCRRGRRPGSSVRAQRAEMAHGKEGSYLAEYFGSSKNAFKILSEDIVYNDELNRAREDRSMELGRSQP